MSYLVSYHIESWADRVPISEKDLRKLLRKYHVRFNRKGGRVDEEYTSDRMDNGSRLLIEWQLERQMGGAQ